MAQWKEYTPVFVGMLIPAAGHLMIGRPQRGFILLLWMLVMGFITYQLTDESISFVGRYSGGFAIYLLSVLDVHGTITKRRRHQS